MIIKEITEHGWREIYVDTKIIEWVNIDFHKNADWGQVRCYSNVFDCEKDMGIVYVGQDLPRNDAIELAIKILNNMKLES